MYAMKVFLLLLALGKNGQSNLAWISEMETYNEGKNKVKVYE